VNVLVLNPGSATLKFGLYRMPDLSKPSLAGNSATVLASGVVERIGTPQAELKMLVATRKRMLQSVEANTPAHAVEHIIRRLLASDGENTPTRTTIDAVGCRVVHGGPRLVAPTRVTPSVLEELRALEELAPLHIPADVAVLEQVQKSLPETTVIAVFDTAFHQTLPEVARTYAIPLELSARYGLRRYGFHGISHAYVSKHLIERLGRGAKGTKIITCHLGSGASVCAVRAWPEVSTQAWG
jgi:acetate kinase